MAETTTSINGCNAVIRLEDNLGNLVDISGSSNEFNLDLANKLGEFHVFGGRWTKRKECKSDATLKLKIVYTTAANEGLDLLINWFFVTRGDRTVRLFPYGEATGADRWDGDYLIESANGIGAPAERAEPIMIDLTLKPIAGVAHNNVGS